MLLGIQLELRLLSSSQVQAQRSQSFSELCRCSASFLGQSCFKQPPQPSPNRTTSPAPGMSPGDQGRCYGREDGSSIVIGGKGERKCSSVVELMSRGEGIRRMGRGQVIPLFPTPIFLWVLVTS